MDPRNSDEHFNMEIKIKCEGADIIQIDKLTPFQGKLKGLSDEGYQRLKQSILDLGVSFPISAWKHRNKTFILDAHQRVETLKRMRAEGYTIPEIPVIWVEAENIKEAAKKLLAAASQYGEISTDGLFSFMESFKLDMKDLTSSFKFPEIDFESFDLTYFGAPPVPASAISGNYHNPGLVIRRTPEETENWKGMPEFVQEDKEPFRSVIIHFFDQAGVDEFARLINQKITDKTRMAWYPNIIIEKASDKRYGQ